MYSLHIFHSTYVGEIFMTRQMNFWKGTAHQDSSRRLQYSITFSSTKPQAGAYLSYKPSLEQIDSELHLDNGFVEILASWSSNFKWCIYPPLSILSRKK